jgi:ribosome biogenesis GTPase
MNPHHLDLRPLGWNDWLAERTESQLGTGLARVAAVDRDRLLLMDETGYFRAALSGSFRHRHQQVHEQPCVGDWVYLDKYADDELGMIQGVLPRRTSLRRKSAGTAIDFQMIATNIDYVFIVQSCHFDFNQKRLERYLVMVSDGGAEPCIVLTKTDLVAPSVIASQVSSLTVAGVTAPILTLSSVTGEGIDRFQQQLLPGNTYCFVGSSGVGKSTLINGLLCQQLLETNSVSGTGEGRHTTVRRELICLASGALVIDTPGMREFGVLATEDGLTNGFPDIAELASHCRYRDCSHTCEPGCAILEAIQSETLDQEHYDNYLKLRSESRFHQMSYAEKRKRERDFGKFIKSVKKWPKH